MNPVPPALLQRAIEFHGHLGPFMALGLRVGWLAKHLLHAGPFDIRAEVGCPLTPPDSCFIDGIQMGSGCTTGKANLRHREDRRLWVQFEGPNGNLRYRIRDQGLELIAEAFAQKKDISDLCAEIATGKLDNAFFSLKD